MTENTILFHKDDTVMRQAYEQAQNTFKYFWRELSWEFRRIVPGLDMAYAKIAFAQETDDPNNPLVEHMWITDVGFDGDLIYGKLVNEPNELTNIKNGDAVSVPLSHLSDWLFVSQGRSYGGFTIQVIRSQMTDKERKEHDTAWGINFGDYNDILVVYEQKEHPENMEEHPMSSNMKEKLEEFLRQYPTEVTHQDEAGYTMLHRETIAGNRTSVEALLKAGADPNLRTQSGKTALDFARQLQWNHLVEVLK